MEKWLVQAKKADFNGLANSFNISPITARIIRNRDIITEEEYKEYLECNLKNVESPFNLKGMKQAIDVIIAAINENKKIRVIGDYDIDGVCSGYILTTGLEKFGANVDFDVPDRIIDGYGLNVRLIEKAKEDNVDLIITCDNGISAASQIEYAYELGMKVIVTDHHEVPYELMEDGTKKYILPKAEAVIDHKQVDCPYKFKELCGAGVAYKLIKALYQVVISERKQMINREIPMVTNTNEEEFFKEFLVFASIATIGDIVDLLGENRTMVKHGLRYINEINNPGLRALINENELGGKEIVSYHISFVIGPCINAGGRLETAMKAFMLFRCKDNDEAIIRARELKAINDERKDLTIEYTNKAIDAIEKDEKYSNDSVLVMYLPGCHESLAGIIAGKLREKFYKPSYVITDCEDGVKGSGRSVEDYNMYEEMVKADTIFAKENNGEHLLKKYGGHKMAAGFSLDKDKIDAFRKILNESDTITENMLIEKVWIDVPMPFEYISENLINELVRLEPFGKANEKPIFAEKCHEVASIRVNGKNGNVVALRLKNQNGTLMEGTLFADGDDFLDELRSKFGNDNVTAALNGRANNIKMNIIYYPEINEYRGFRNIRVVIKKYSC